VRSSDAGGSIETMQGPTSINDIRTAIRELSVRADLARKEGRDRDAVEIEKRIQGYREDLSQRPRD
jgi:propanediol dehydratase small subunit